MPPIEEAASDVPPACESPAPGAGAHALQSRIRMNLTSRDHALRVAVWSVLASEALVFTALLVMHGATHLASRTPAPLLAIAITTGALFAGGACVALAVRRTRQGQLAAAARTLVIVGALGVIALACELIGARRGSPRDPLSTVIVGLHAAHVAAGIALTTWVLALMRIRHVHRRHHDVLALVASYWYFVAGVWVFVWPLLAARP